MRPKIKDLRRADWTRVTRRKDIYIPFDKYGYRGEAACIRLEQVRAPLDVHVKDDCTLRIVDEGYTWLILAFEERPYWLTVMYDVQGRLIQYYFDITLESHVLPAGGSWFADMFLDVVLLPDGRIFLLDEDELDEALAQGDIGMEEHMCATKAAQTLRHTLQRDSETIRRLCDTVLAACMEKMDRC